MQRASCVTVPGCMKAIWCPLTWAFHCSLHVTLLCEIHLLLLISLSLLFSSLQQRSCSCHQLLVHCRFAMPWNKCWWLPQTFCAACLCWSFSYDSADVLLKCTGFIDRCWPGVFGPPGVANAQRATLASAIVDNWIHKNVVRSRVRRVSSVYDGAPGN